MAHKVKPNLGHAAFGRTGPPRWRGKSVTLDGYGCHNSLLCCARRGCLPIRADGFGIGIKTEGGQMVAFTPPGQFCKDNAVTGLGTGRGDALPPDLPQSHQHRTLFLSDLHLGAIGARADLILAFLQHNQAQTYVLIGDILDLWHPVLPHWGTETQAVIDHLAARKAAGAELIYLRGNHDPEPDTAPQGRRLPVPAIPHAEHLGADGRRYLVIHGDCQDVRVLRSLLLRRIGSRIDEYLRQLDRRLRRLRPRAARPERASWAERVIAGFNAWIYRSRGYERRLVALARARGLDGVICGHFHIPALHDDHGLVYANCGDWVDSRTAITEDFNGSLRLVAFEAAQTAGSITRPPGLTAPLQVQAGVM